MVDRKNPIIIGVLGGGQLAQMLGEALIKLRRQCPVDLRMRFLAQNADDPVYALKAQFDPRNEIFEYVLNPSNSTTCQNATDNPLHLFMSAQKRSFSLSEISEVTSKGICPRGLDIILFENEFVDCQLLRDHAQLFSNIQFFPGLKTIELFQNKWEQKKLWGKLNLPTSPFLDLSEFFVASSLPNVSSQSLSKARLEQMIAKVAHSLGNRFVLKWAKYGYDGKGVWVSPLHDLDTELGECPELEKLSRFCDQALANQTTVFAEKWVPFEKELATIGCQSPLKSNNQSFLPHPVVETIQTDGTCLLVHGPIDDRHLANEVQQASAKIAYASGLVGSFGLECFSSSQPLQCHQGGTSNWLINEIAPRVHNSGHYTQDTPHLLSQFESHLRAALQILNPPLPSELALPLTHPQVDFDTSNVSFGMLNLLGPSPKNFELHANPIKAWSTGLPSRFKFHWYEKKSSSPKRKLGHINWVSHSRPEFQKDLKHMANLESAFYDRVRLTQSKESGK